MLQRERRAQPESGAGMARRDDLVVVGRISGAYGIKGWVRVASFTDPVANLAHYWPWSLRVRDSWRPIEVEELKPHGGGFVAQLKGVVSRDEAERLAGTEIAIPASALPAIGPEEFYWKDLLGLDVVTPAGVMLGRVVQMMETGANDVLVVADADGVQTLIPFVAAVVRDVDVGARRLVADWAVGADED